MGVFDKIKTSASEVSQKTNNWSAEALAKTKSSVAGAVDKISASLRHKHNSNESCGLNGDEHTEQVTVEDVKARNGKARNLIDNLIASIKDQLSKIDINEVIDALQVYSEKSGKDFTLLIDFIKQLTVAVNDVATKGVLVFLVFLRNTPFSSILKLAKSIVKLMPIPGMPIIIMILEMMIKVEWLLDKVLDIIIKDIEKKQVQSVNEKLLTN